MINRKILYGYQIQNGEIAVVEDEALVVQRVFSLYLGGQSYQRISDTLNGEEIPFCREAPLWNKHKVKRLLENPRYAGRSVWRDLARACSTTWWSGSSWNPRPVSASVCGAAWN